MSWLTSFVLFAAVIGQTARGAADLDKRGTPAPPATMSQDAASNEAEWLAPPELVLIAEKEPFELPDGQILILFDHKVGRDRIRYEVEGVEYKPRVGETVALLGPDYVVLVTCTQWKLLKKEYGRDSAEFQIECLSRPALRASADIAPRSPAPAALHAAPAPEPRHPPRVGSRPLPPPEEGGLPPEPRAAAPRVPPPSAAQRPRPAVAEPQYPDLAPEEQGDLPTPVYVILAEKRPFYLPNGQILILKDHKVGHDQIRYEIDGIEYQPAVGETLVFPGEPFFVQVTCTQWKLLKKHYGEDSAEFLIESFPAP